MKWVTLICLLFCTIVTESRHLHKRDADHHSRECGPIFKTVGESNFNHLSLAMIAQNLQKCSLEEQEKLMNELSHFAKDCAEHEEKEECKKPMATILYDYICKIPHLDEGYPWSTDCCLKADLEREKCFRDHRVMDVEPYKRPDVDGACKLHKEQPEHALHYYIVTIAKRNPFLYSPAVIGLAEKYNSIITQCCALEEKEEKEKCCEPKFIEMQKLTYGIVQKQNQVCHILSTFPERVYQAMKLAKFSQKFPLLTFEDAHKLTLESVHVSKDCCEGHEIECMIEKMEFNQHVCEHMDKISPKLKDCCEKPLMERTPCIIALPDDEVPHDPAKVVAEFLENDQVCKHFAEEQDKHLAKFLHTFSKGHHELSVQDLLRCGKGYEKLLTKCCAEEHPTDCLKAGPEILKQGIKETQDLVRENCGAYEKLDPFGYQMATLYKYVTKMPQVTDATLLGMTGKMTKFAGKCCALPVDQRGRCGEEKVDLLLGEMCERQKTIFVNDQVRHCCTDSYADRRPCFSKLGVDPSYHAPEFDAAAFHVGAEICEGTEEEQKAKRLTLFIHVMKAKPNIKHEKVTQCAKEFAEIRVKCCAAADRDICFAAEVRFLRYCSGY
ncbi:hypothetical protein PRIEUP_LOCUS16925, partial [Pristimantis euphronides]